MPSTNSLRPRTGGQAVTNIHLKTNWSNWSAETLTASSPLDTPETSMHNTPNRSSSSSLSSLEEEIDDRVPFPELEVSELDFQLLLLELQPAQQLKKTEPLKSISTVPNYDLAKFFTLAQPRAIMPIETLQIFHGDGRALENPADFLKLFN
jgi:hypothetical protein